MDANGTRFHLFLGEGDWATCTDVSGGADAEAAGDDGVPTVGTTWNAIMQEQTLRPALFHFVAGAGDRLAELADRRGAARDRYGNWYWLDPDEKTIRVRSTGDGRTTVFWPLDAPPARRRRTSGDFVPAARPGQAAVPPLGGLCVTTHHYLVVGRREPAGLLVFDLHAGGPPLLFDWPESVPFVPFDMAATARGGVVVLDRANRLLWELDARFRIIGSSESAAAAQELEAFRPETGPVRARRSPADSAARVLALATAIAGDPIAVENARDGSFLVLDRSENRVLPYRSGGLLGPPAALDFSPLLFGSDAFSRTFELHDFAYLPATKAGTVDRIYVVTAEGNQAFAFAVGQREGALTLDVSMEYLPLRLFQGKALVSATDAVFYDYPKGFAPVVEQKRPRYVQSGVLMSPVLDGKTPDCVWHRLVLDGRIPDGASVGVESRASDDPGELLHLPFFEEPRPYRRGNGPELPYLPRSSIGDYESFELLFQKARGRHLQLRLTLSGNGRVTPRLRTLRVWYPRFSYLERYLPAAYAQEPDSASFLERYLANVEGTFTSIEDLIAGAQTLFDVRSAPADALEWLSSWFGVALDPAWDESRRRLFIRHAMDFFQYRGTARGLRMALRLALERCADERIFTAPDDPTETTVRIVERFRSRSAPGVYSGDVTDGIGVRLVSLEKRWKPVQRREALDERWRVAVEEAGLAPSSEYPVRPPAEASTATLWRRFSRDTLGFVPVSTDDDVGLWREFVADRYRNVTALNAAYRSSFGTFSELRVPSELPPNGAPLLDWFQFEEVVQPMRATAHRFRVLIPTALAGETDAERTVRLQLATRIVELEKPAHTVCEVRFYYAMFRVGEARLGFDSLVDLGGRAPELMAPFVLGPTHLAEGYLAARPPGDARDRSVLGRDRLAT